MATGLEKVRFYSNPKEGQCQRMFKYCTIMLISHVYKVMLKILQARLQQHLNWELPDVLIQAGFRKGRWTRDQIANIHWLIEKAREFQKIIYSSFTDYTKAFVRITTNCGKLLKRWEYQTTLLVSWETCVLVKKQQLEPDMEQWTDSKLRKEFIKALCCHPACLTYVQSR